MKKTIVSFAAALMLTVFATVGTNAYSLNSMFLKLGAEDSAAAKVADKIEKMDGVKSVFYNPENGVVSILYMDDVNPDLIKNEVGLAGYKTDGNLTVK